MWKPLLGHLMGSEVAVRLNPVAFTAFRMKLPFQDTDYILEPLYFLVGMVKQILIIILKYISQDVGLHNQKSNIYVPNIILFRIIHSDSFQCEACKKLNFWPEFHSSKIKNANWLTWFCSLGLNQPSSHCTPHMYLVSAVQTKTTPSLVSNTNNLVPA